MKTISFVRGELKPEWLKEEIKKRTPPTSCCNLCGKEIKSILEGEIWNDGERIYHSHKRCHDLYRHQFGGDI